jgi:hypothetical protein
MKKILIYGILIGGLILAVSRPTQSGKDQTQAWADYRKAVIQQEKIDKAERARVDAIIKDRTDSYYAELKAKYPPYKPVWGPMPASFVSEYFQPMPETRSSYQDYDQPTYSSRRQEQPDLSGLYYQRTIVGPNAGQWSIQFVSGPN